MKCSSRDVFGFSPAMAHSIQLTLLLLVKAPVRACAARAVVFSGVCAGSATVSLPSCTWPEKNAGPSSLPSGCINSVTSPSGVPATSSVNVTGAARAVGSPSKRK